jgi:hypothetical protein
LAIVKLGSAGSYIGRSAERTSYTAVHKPASKWYYRGLRGISRLPPFRQRRFYLADVALAAERDRRRVLKVMRNYRKRDQRVFVGLLVPSQPHIETPEEVRDRVIEAPEDLPIEEFGIFGESGFSPIRDDIFHEPGHCLCHLRHVWAQGRRRSLSAVSNDDEEG